MGTEQFEIVAWRLVVAKLLRRVDDPLERVESMQTQKAMRVTGPCTTSLGEAPSPDFVLAHQHPRRQPHSVPDSHFYPMQFLDRAAGYRRNFHVRTASKHQVQWTRKAQAT